MRLGVNCVFVVVLLFLKSFEKRYADKWQNQIWRRRSKSFGIFMEKTITAAAAAQWLTEEENEEEAAAENPVEHTLKRISAQRKLQKPFNNIYLFLVSFFG